MRRTFRSGLLRALLALAVPAIQAEWALADSLWDHNGSVMRLIEQDGQLDIFYEVPRAGMVEQGVRRGQLFFNGRRTGNSVAGIARAFSRRCPAPMEYAIKGVMKSGVSIVLEGRRPVFSDCRPQKTLKNDRLVFTFMANVADSRTAAPGDSPEDAPAGTRTDEGIPQVNQLLRLHRPNQ